MLVLSVDGGGGVSVSAIEPLISAVSGVPLIYELALIISTWDGVSENNVDVDGTDDRLLIRNSSEEIITGFQSEVSLSCETSREPSVHINSHVDQVHIEGDWLNESVFDIVSSLEIKFLEEVGLDSRLREICFATVCARRIGTTGGAAFELELLRSKGSDIEGVEDGSGA